MSERIFGEDFEDKLFLTSFWGGEKKRCVQLTMKPDDNKDWVYATFTFEEFEKYCKAFLKAIKKQTKKYNKNPPWWEFEGKGDLK